VSPTIERAEYGGARRDRTYRGHTDRLGYSQMPHRCGLHSIKFENTKLTTRENIYRVIAVAIS